MYKWIWNIHETLRLLLNNSKHNGIKTIIRRQIGALQPTSKAVLELLPSLEIMLGGNDEIKFFLSVTNQYQTRPSQDVSNSRLDELKRQITMFKVIKDRKEEPRSDDAFKRAATLGMIESMGFQMKHCH